MGRARDILDYYHIDKRDFPEAKEVLKRKLTERGKKWESASGQNMEDIISILDAEFTEGLYLSLSRIARELDKKEAELNKQVQDIRIREKNLAEKEQVVEYPFKEDKFKDVYTLSVALKDSFKNRADMTDKEVQLRIIEMCEKVILKGE